jgi:hypothetical protein
LISTLTDQSVWEENISFTQPPEELVLEIIKELIPCKESDAQYIALGIFYYMMRMLQNEIGIGNHPFAIRPLNNPLQTIINLSNHNIVALESPGSLVQTMEGYKFNNLVQLIGMEFFGVNRHLRNFLSWANIQWWAAVRWYPEREVLPWRLDRTNPNGENIIPDMSEVVGFIVTLNDNVLTAEETKIFYNELRKREYQWHWYNDNKTSWREVLSSLQKIENGKSIELEIVKRFQILGLLDGNQKITNISSSILSNQNAIERKPISFCGRILNERR